MISVTTPEEQYRPPRAAAIGGVRLCLLDDHVLLRESLARLLASEPNFELVAQCATAPEALDSLRGADVDVVVMDQNVGKDFIARAREIGYGGRFLVIAPEIDPAGSARAFSEGASGVFLGSESSARLIQAICAVASGEAWVDQKLIQLLAARYPQFGGRLETLTVKESQVLDGVVAGLTNREIAGGMGMTESAIKAILQKLFHKCGVRTRSQLVRVAMENHSRPD